MKALNFRLIQASQRIDLTTAAAVAKARRENRGISQFEKVKRRLLARKKPT